MPIITGATANILCNASYMRMQTISTSARIPVVVPIHTRLATPRPSRESPQCHTARRLIAPDGSYPSIGRSITYRSGAFHHLANMALRSHLPPQLKPAQVRCALTAVISKFTASKDLFDQNGWLQIGLYGHQPSLAEGYISTGSLYLCSAILLPLGLPASDPFWSSPDEDWTSKKIAKGLDLLADHSL